MIRIFTISLLTLSLVSCSSEKQHFKIDTTVSSVIDSIFKANGEADANNAECLVHIKNTFQYEEFGQNGRDLVYFLRSDSSKAKDIYINSLSECLLNKDTINLTIVLSHESNVALKIVICNNKVSSQLRVIAAEKIYSKDEKSNNLQKDLISNFDTIILTLSEKPEFKSGSTLKGKMDVKFTPFYQVDTSGRLSKITPEFSIVFNTEVR